MIDCTKIGWQESWFGKYSVDLSQWYLQPTHEIGYTINLQFELDVEKIVRNVMLRNLEPLTYKDIQPILKDMYFAFDPEEQVKYKGQRLYKATGDIEDWERQLAYEINKMKEERKERIKKDLMRGMERKEERCFLYLSRSTRSRSFVRKLPGTRRGPAKSRSRSQTTCRGISWSRSRFTMRITC